MQKIEMPDGEDIIVIETSEIDQLIDEIKNSLIDSDGIMPQAISKLYMTIYNKLSMYIMDIMYYFDVIDMIPRDELSYNLIGSIYDKDHMENEFTSKVHMFKRLHSVLKIEEGINEVINL